MQSVQENELNRCTLLSSNLWPSAQIKAIESGIKMVQLNPAYYTHLQY